MSVGRRKGAPERFWSKVDRRGPDECWPWTAYTHKGYGQFSLDGRPYKAHRFGYEQMVGPIPAGMQLDHLCRNRACVNPAHLEPVTNAENTRRGLAGRTTGAQQRSKTHCREGHPYDEENTYVCKKGQRHCRECGRAAWRRYNARRKAAS